MFTVCPKCALTLVVTAADLRVAQGYVRCGRCSNVFNALARLSEDRQSAAAQGSTPQSSAPQDLPAQAPPPPPSTSGLAVPSSSPADTPARSEEPAPKPPLSTSAPAQSMAAPSAPSGPSNRAPLPADPEAFDDDSIPETALEFNPEATDVTKLFVEPPPNPHWTAATGSFKAIVLQSEETEHAEADDTSERTSSPGRARTEHDPGQAPDAQLDVEIDPEMIVAAAARDTPARRETPAPYETSGKRESPAARGTSARRDAPATQDAPATRETPAARERPAGRDNLRRPDAATPMPPPVSRTATPKPTRPEAKIAPRAASGAVARFAADDGHSATTPSERLETIGRARATPPEYSTDPSASDSRLAALWSVGTGALVIILIAQIVNHYRNDLAANPQLNRPLTALYSALGVPLVPKWDLHAYDVRQLGASVDSASAGQIMVRASVKNSAHQAQPLPLLRVTLQDRFGNRIAARDVPPQSYLPRAIPASSYLSAGQRIDAEMAFVDPGSNAVGFEIDACLPAPAGGINCANDPGVR